MADFCSECGGFTGGKPRVEFERDPAIRAWHVYITRVERDGNVRGMQVDIPDHGDWDPGRPQDLCDGVGFAR